MSIIDRARELTRISPLMQNREKLDLKDFKNTVVHVDAVDFSESSDGKFVIMTFVEHPDKFSFGGQVATDLFVRVLEGYDSLEQLNKELVEMPLPLRFYDRVSKSGRTYTAVMVPLEGDDENVH